MTCWKCLCEMFLFGDLSHLGTSFTWGFRISCFGIIATRVHMWFVQCLEHVVRGRFARAEDKPHLVASGYFFWPSPKLFSCLGLVAIFLISRTQQVESGKTILSEDSKFGWILKLDIACLFAQLQMLECDGIRFGMSCFLFF